MKKADFLIAGGGIVGSTLALELRRRFPDQSVVICEKEQRLGTHSSTRNSGVIHSGIYYEPDSLKAKVCHEGAKRMIAFHEEYSLPISKIGKLLVCPEAEMGDQIDVLFERASRNGLKALFVDEQTLREMEPEARSAGGRAIYVPITAVGDPEATMQVIERHLAEHKVTVLTGAGFANRNRDGLIELTNGEKYECGYFINAAGGFADKVAHAFDLGYNYTIIPFRGLYWQLAPDSGIHLNHLIYPVPNLRFPFLGVHTTTSIDGKVYLGPTATPGLGREHYQGFTGITLTDTMNNLMHFGTQFWDNRDGFRSLALQEIKRLTKGGFVAEARKILPRLTRSMLQPTQKAGVRAQIFDRENGQLVTDFLAIRDSHSLHILNSISPAWTCSFGLAGHICDKYFRT